MSDAASGRKTTILVVDDSPTVLRVVEFVLQQAGYVVVTCESGKLATAEARQHKPALLLVDFNMPQVNGYEVCRQFGEDPMLDQIPIVVMSTRGDPVGDRFVQSMGIVDHITKPFAPEALLAVVQHTLRKAQGNAQTERRRQESDAHDESKSAQAFAALALDLANGITSLSRGKTPDPKLAARLTALLGTPEIQERLRVVSRYLPDSPALVGDLSRVGLAELLQMLAMQRQTGLLTVHHHHQPHDYVVTLALKSGAVRMVTGERLQREFLLGTILVRERLMEARELELFLANRKGTRRRLGEQVVKLGYVKDEDLRRALRRQSSELIYEILRWGQGRFEFRALEYLPDEVMEFDLGMGTDELLMEGFRRVDEWGLIEAVIPDFQAVPHRAPGGVDHAGPEGLTADEQEIYALVDGKRKIQEIVEASSRSTFDASRLLYRLVAARVVSLGDAGRHAGDKSALDSVGLSA